MQQLAKLEKEEISRLEQKLYRLQERDYTQKIIQSKQNKFGTLFAIGGVACFILLMLSLFNHFSGIGDQSLTGASITQTMAGGIRRVSSPLNVSAVESFDCSELIPPENNRYYCVDNQQFYKCKDFEYIERVEEGDMIRCIEAEESPEKVSKKDCPFDHPDCGVTIDIKHGWGKTQAVEKKEYKLSTFHENFYCAKGYCEIPFYFKSNISLEGNLTFYAAAELKLRNISVERVLIGGIKEKPGKHISMQQHDSYYYLLSFEFTPEWTSPTGIRTTKPLKFNISASLDGEKILELDPIAFVSAEGNNVDTDCDAPSTVTVANVNCNSATNDVLIVGVSIQDAGDVTTPTYDSQAMTEIYTKTGTANGVYSQMFYYQGSSCDTTANTVSIGFLNGGNGDDCGVTTVVYSGVTSVDTANDNGATGTSNDPTVSISAGAADNWVVDTVAHDSTAGTIAADGDNTGNARVNYDDGNQKVGASDDGGGGGTVSMSWAGSDSVVWSMIAVPLVGPDSTPPSVNLSYPTNNTWTNNATRQIAFGFAVNDGSAITNCTLWTN
ncbi:MAG: hypothetical protein AABX05_01930, partial [Nanoarchaeota archaeon]